MLLVALPQPVQKQLLDRLVVGHHDMADGVPAHEVAHFLSQVLGVVPGAFQGLRHEDHLQAGLAVHVFWILDVAHENQVSQAVHFSIGAKHVDRLLHVAGGKCELGRACLRDPIQNLPLARCWQS